MNYQVNDDGPMSRSARYGVTAIGIVQAGADEVTQLRTSLGPPSGGKYPPAILKPSDAQTVVGLAAVLQAIHGGGLTATPSTGWGIVASPRFMARSESADSLHKYEIGGAWKVNPLGMPNLAMHAVSATISQLLQVKGPNFGVGGGTNFISDAFLTACTLLDEQQLPGLWLIVTQCDPEPKPDREGKNAGPWVCHAVALAFQEVDAAWTGPRLHFQRTEMTQPAAWCETDGQGDYAALVRFLRAGMDAKRFGSWHCDLDWGARLLLTDEELATSSAVKAACLTA